MTGTPPDGLVHRWQVDERELQRHEQRRGRRHAFERLDPASTALVVIDLVPFFVDNLDYARGVIGPINEAAQTVRSAGGVVVWVVPQAQAPTSLDVEFYGQAVAASYGESGGTGPTEGRVHPALATESGDLFVEKLLPSAFFPGSCGLHDELQARGVDSVLIAGTVANVCCESSARDARTLGYRVVMLADATAAPTDEILNATLRTIYRSFGDVRSTSELPELLAAGTGEATDPPGRGETIGR